MAQLSSLLKLFPVDENILSAVRRTERVVPSVLTSGGLLLDPNSMDSNLYTVIERLLTAKDRRQYKSNTKALEGVEGIREGEPAAACDLACDAYTPMIDSAYYLGLAMGFAVAGTLGSASVR